MCVVGGPSPHFENIKKKSNRNQLSFCMFNRLINQMRTSEGIYEHGARLLTNVCLLLVTLCMHLRPVHIKALTEIRY